MKSKKKSSRSVLSLSARDRALEAARLRARPERVLSRTEALAEAPWEAQSLPEDWERDFRSAYATALEERGFSRPGYVKESGSGGKGKHPARALRIPDEEWKAYQWAAKQMGLSFSVWARAILSEAVEKLRAKNG